MRLRAVRAGFLLLACLIAGRLPDADETPPPVLHTLATDEADFRGCDRDWNQVNPFWTAEPAIEASPAPELNEGSRLEPNR